MYSFQTMPSTTSILSAYTAFAAAAMLLRTMINEIQTMTIQIIPEKLRSKIISSLRGLFRNHSSRMSLIIDEQQNGLSINHVYEASEVYLQSRISPCNERLKVFKAPNDDDFHITMDKGEEITDVFDGIQLKWVMVCEESQKTSLLYDDGFSTEKVEQKSIELSFCRTHKEKVLSSYLPYVMEFARSKKEDKKEVKLYSWENFNGIKLNHPSTFETLAMDPSIKKALMDDLDRFVRRREFYRRVGKVWKRGYLLYGPPGTGKSSLIAAIANYLKFDVYDLDLTSIRTNCDLRRLLLSTANRSIIVIEDIDCSIKLENRQAGAHDDGDSQLTLSGLLNFIDGLWSSLGDERIIIFTTNYKERLDPALLRPGRMDMHIHMSYLTPSGFKILASNYFNMSSHPLLSQIEELISQVEVTPAVIAEELMKSEDVETALERLVEFLEAKKLESKQAGGGGTEVEEVKELEVQEVVKSVKKKKQKGKKKKSKKTGHGFKSSNVIQCKSS
ncbi:hypothetical protein Ancab_021354 [Ancistrocladus abbreviatus]